ncbi:MAG: tRNA pseudouridine(38-40) synthase TruA [Anaerolineae bacterium]|nr:tRNA pseudouridine(38-40) synthase TruA [Anaerolineae bacterium]
MRYRVTVAYDGTAYYGFQRQADVPTVQATLEEALARVAGQPVGIVGSGRTDTGVHAVGQVIAFNLSWRHSPENLRNALNANLPDDIAVLKVRETDPDFHPRYDALFRCYQYRLYVAPVRDPLQRRRAWHLSKPLNVAGICEAVEYLAGPHDFSTFGSPPQGENSVRTVLEAAWRDDFNGNYTFTITADAFLYRMVRTITATLVMVGQGDMTAAAFRGILAARQRALAAAPAPPYGLTLMAVYFAEED